MLMSKNKTHEIGEIWLQELGWREWILMSVCRALIYFQPFSNLEDGFVTVCSMHSLDSTRSSCIPSTIIHQLMSVILQLFGAQPNGMHNRRGQMSISQ